VVGTKRELPEWVRGEWCNLTLAEQDIYPAGPKTLEEVDDWLLRQRWVRALLSGDLKAAHAAWGKWQGYTGRDPWEDRGWSNFLKIQRFGESLWDDFDASRFDERVWLKTSISYWPNTDQREG